MQIFEYIPDQAPSAAHRAEFSTVDELYQVSWINSYMARPGFYRFARYGDLLIAEICDGYAWRIVGTIIGDDDPDRLPIPEWTYPRQQPRASPSGFGAKRTSRKSGSDAARRPRACRW